MTATPQTPPPERAPAAPIRVNPDPLNWPRIPKEAKVKLGRLRRAHDDAWLIWRAIADERQAAWEARRAAEARLKVLTGGRPDSAWHGFAQSANFQRLSDDDPQVAVQLEELEDAKANIERLNPIVEARSHQLSPIRPVKSSVEGYLTEGLRGVGNAIKLHKGPAPSPHKGESLVDAVERCRRRVRELDADRHRIASAPWHSDGGQAARARGDRKAGGTRTAERPTPN